MPVLALAALSALEAAEVYAGAESPLHMLVAGAAAAGAFATAAIIRQARRTQLAAVLHGLEALRGFDVAVLVLADPAGRILFVNDIGEVVYGRRREELLALRLKDLGHPIAPDASDGLDGADGRRTYSSVHERGDGSPFPVDVITRRLTLDGKEHTLTVVRDVTEERLTQAAVTESLEQNRAVFHNVAMVQFSLDADGRFSMIEGRGLEALRLQPGELVGRTIFEAAKALPELIKGFLRALGGTIFSAVYRVGRFSFDVHWTPLLRSDGTIRGVTGIAVDVTDRVAAEGARKETEAKLVAAERLASMGRLAAGVAHEINNPLAWVMSNLEMAIDRLGMEEKDVELRELLGDAKVGAERVRDIVRDLRVFARSDGEAGGRCDAVAVAKASLAMARNELRHRAQVETSFEPVPAVAIPQRQLGQVLVNLLVNAAQAIREGSAAENVVRVSVRSDADAVVIEVRDSGSGMSTEVRDRIFEPFFTTKSGEGMGLGLSICQTMVREAGGRILVESAPGAGSTFRVILPTLTAASACQAETPPQGVAAAPPRAEPLRLPIALAPGRRSRLLVVDDEPLVGKTVARVLAEHDVEYVAGAKEALDRIHAGSRYDALICDLMMPEMTGMELAERLADEAHELSRRVVFLTGGAFTDRARTFVAFTRAPVVEKPFEQGQLKRSVDQVLRGA